MARVRLAGTAGPVPQLADGFALAPTFAAPADPINPEVNVSDFIHLQTYELPGQVVTWANAAAAAPSTRQVRWTIPPIGLLSRIVIDVDGGSATGYDVTVGGGAAAAAAQGDGPYGLVENVQLKVGGSVAIYDVSGFGTYLLEACESVAAIPQTQGVAVVYTTAPTDVESTIWNYPANADGRPRWGITVPLSLTPGNPLGMVLAGNDQTSMELVLTLNGMDRYAALTGGAVALMSLTFTPTLELFAIPEPDAFARYVRPYLDWAHVNRETRQNITATGDNFVDLDNHDNLLQVIHSMYANSVLNTDAISRGKFVLNRTDYRYDDNAAYHWRRQRRHIGKDVPAWLWPFFTEKTLRDAIRTDLYTSVRSVVNIAAGTTLGTAWFMTAERRLVQLDARPAGA